MKRYTLFILILVGIFTTSIGFTSVLAAMPVEEVKPDREVIVDSSLSTISPGIEQQLITPTPPSSLAPGVLDQPQIVGQTIHTIFLPFTVHNGSTGIVSRTYYVATTGSDTNNGISINTPFKTIQKAVDLATSPGDTILVLPGVYRQTSGTTSSGLITIVDKHGSAGNHITLKAHDPNNSGLPTTLMGYGHAIRIVGSSYYTVDGFDITDTYHSAISSGVSDHITISNNHIHFGFTGFCQGNETGDFQGCTVGAVKGRYYTTGAPIVEYDQVQNTGMTICKTTNSQIINNRIENVDEGIYLGTAGDVTNSDCYASDYGLNLSRMWTEGNVLSGNLIENSVDEAIELKPDTRNNIVQANVVRSTRQNNGSTAIEIRGHYNEVSQNIVVGAPVIGIRAHSESPGDPGPDRGEAYTYVKSGVLRYMSSYKNYLHHNYVYYFSQFQPSGYGMVSLDTSAANRIEHNTIVGVNDSPVNVSEYASLKTVSKTETTVTNNLRVGVRRSSSAGITRYEYHLLSYAGFLPQASNYNEYYPRLRNNNECVVGLGTLGIICQNNSSQNATLGYEYNSLFLDQSPLVIDGLCSKDSLLALPMAELKDRVLNCSVPLIGSAIVGAAGDGTNIGAYQ